MTVTTFSELELDESLLEALQDKGFTRPTAIQAAAIPPALDGRDVLGSAPTGTGKTAAYLLPALQHLLDFPRKKSGPPRILILTPTRELAMQVADHARELAKHTHLDIATITGQKPITTKARKSVANFKVREGETVGVKVTLRQDRMWEFLDRLFNIALPRVRDFRGISADAFDGRGNYSLGLKEQIIFPEIEYDKIEKLRGMNIAIITTAKTDEEARELLKLMGAPFVTKA